MGRFEYRQSRTFPRHCIDGVNITTVDAEYGSVAVNGVYLAINGKRGGCRL